MRSLFVTMSFAVCAAATTAYAQTPTISSEPSINASARAEVRVRPTRAIVSFTVQAKGETAARAASENARLVASTIRALNAAGRKAEDISNSLYNVGVDHDNRGKPIGFVATNGIRVEVPNIEDVGRVIDAGLAGGATQVASTQYIGAGMEEARRNALKAAVDEARKDAEAMAAAGGGQLGKLLNLTSGGTVGAPIREAYLTSAVATGAMVPTDIRPSDLVVIAVASGRWEFIAKR